MKNEEIDKDLINKSLNTITVETKMKSMNRPTLEEYAKVQRRWKYYFLMIGFSLAVFAAVFSSLLYAYTFQEHYRPNIQAGLMTMGNDMCDEMYGEDSVNVKVLEGGFVEVYCENNFIGLVGK